MTAAPRRRHTPSEVHDAAGLLGVALPASPAEIRRAWRQALRVTHPDHANPAARRAAEHLASQLNEARDILLASGDLHATGPVRRSLTEIVDHPRQASVHVPAAPPHPGHARPPGGFHGNEVLHGPPHAWPPPAHPSGHPDHFVQPGLRRVAPHTVTAAAPASTTLHKTRLRAAIVLVVLFVLVVAAVALSVVDLLDGLPLP